VGSLSEIQRKSIIEAVKIDENGRPIILINDQGQPLGTISNDISNLLYNRVYHFDGNYQDIYEKIRKHVINLKCKTMTDLRRYKDYFLSKLYTLLVPNQRSLERKIYMAYLPYLLKRLETC
jgi:hypothetical protein